MKQQLYLLLICCIQIKVKMLMLNLVKACMSFLLEAEDLFFEDIITAHNNESLLFLSHFMTKFYLFKNMIISTLTY
jgi:hypothetical protein